MSIAALSGSDTVTINNRIFSDVADGDVAILKFDNEIATLKTGKNGNSIYALNATGKQSTLDLRLIKGSSDDKYLNDLLVQQQSNFAGFVLMTGEFVKKIGDGSGKVSSDTYILSGGVFIKLIEAKQNAEGDTEQSVSVYSMKFSNSPRAIS